MIKFFDVERDITWDELVYILTYIIECDEQYMANVKNFPETHDDIIKSFTDAFLDSNSNTPINDFISLTVECYEELTLYKLQEMYNYLIEIEIISLCE